MKTINLIAINKGESGGSMSRSIYIGEKTTVDSIKEAFDEFSAQADAAYGRWYYEAESDGELTSGELKMVEEAGIELDF